MASRTLNFDNFMVEKKEEPILVTVYRKQYPVKPAIPAVVMITLARASDGEMSDADSALMIYRAGDILFGKEAIDEMCRKGMSAEQLANLIKAVFETVNGKNVDGEDTEEMDDESGMVAASGSEGKK